MPNYMCCSGIIASTTQVVKMKQIKYQNHDNKIPRLASIDVFRGLALAGMIIVNNPGNWQQMYVPLIHARWHGCAPPDLIFPFFLFIVGTSLSFSIAKQTEVIRKNRVQIYLHIIQRSAILFTLGLFLNCLSLALESVQSGLPLNFCSLRIMGVLQRISLAYLLTGFAVLNLSSIKLLVMALVILGGYWAVMFLVPLPGCGAGSLSPEGNLIFYLDHLILGPAHMYREGKFDPEGLLSTLPASVTVLSGYLAGRWIRVQPVRSKTSFKLFLSGLICLVTGYLWGLVFPINKSLWTSSYVVFTSGWALLVMSACFEAIEVMNWRTLGWPLEIIGLNSILFFVGSGVMSRILYKVHMGSNPHSSTVSTWLYKTVFLPWAGPAHGSFVFSICYLCFWWLILYGMYRQHWFIRV